MDSAIYAGYSIPPYYDSLIGKLIVHAPTRDAALSRLDRALSELIVDGIETTTPLFQQPLTISQISFATKKPVENHMLMCGDSAGMIHPLCGNGMSMAINASQIASKLVVKYLDGEITSRNLLEQEYRQQWNKTFKNRLTIGHLIAKLFRQQKLSEIVLYLLRMIPFILPKIISQTHGKTIKI